MGRTLQNIYELSVKELRSLWRDRAMLILILWAFSIGITAGTNARPESLQDAAIAIVDEDQSILSNRIADAFYPPYFVEPHMVSLDEADYGLDQGQYTFVLNIPPNFERDTLAGKRPLVQLNTDATRMTQAFSGSSYVQQIVLGQVGEYLQRSRQAAEAPVELNMRVRFNPSLTKAWFESILQVVNNITMLSLVLTGAALIREREHGTVEHLLVMPVTPFEIMTSKVLAMGLVVLIATALALQFVVQGWLGVPIQGSVLLFLFGTALHLFSMTSMGIFLGTIARSMPQFALLMIMVFLPMNLLSGGQTPRENMPQIIQDIMLAAPTTHFVSMAQAILFRGAGLETVWPQFLALLVIGGLFFGFTLSRFRRTIGDMA